MNKDLNGIGGSLHRDTGRGKAPPGYVVSQLVALEESFATPVPHSPDIQYSYNFQGDSHIGFFSLSDNKGERPPYMVSQSGGDSTHNFISPYRTSLRHLLRKKGFFVWVLFLSLPSQKGGMNK